MSSGAKVLVPMLLAVVLAASSREAGAQGAAAAPPPFELDLPRMDAAVGLGWFNATYRVSPARRDWYNDAAWWEGRFGYYVTENLKLEAELGLSGEGRGWGADQGVLPSGRPYYANREHSFTTRTVSGAVVYQFGHNLTLHPFVGAGVDVDFTRDHVVTRDLYYPYYPGDAGGLPLPRPDETTTERRIGGFGLVGVKAYFNERVFMRSDFKLGTSGTQRKAILRIGLGVDF